MGERAAARDGKRLVGRGHELDLLASWIDAGASQPPAVFLRGVAGVGKTTLARFAAREAAVQRWRVVHGRCAPDRRALQPLQEVMLDLPPARGARADAFEETLAALVGGGGDGVPQHSMLVLGEAIVRALAAGGGEQPVLMAIEDLHWADPDTATVVEYIVDHAASARIAMLATLRPEDGVGLDLATRLGARRDARVVDVRPFSLAETIELASVSLGIAAVPDDLASALHGRSDGIPFFLEEVIAAAVADGVINESDGLCEYDGGLADVIPATVQDLVLMRAGALAPDVRAMLECAAALGREFSARALATVAGVTVPAAAALLREATRAMFIEAAPGGRMRFRHELTRDAFLAGMLPVERHELCRRIVAACAAPDSGLDIDTMSLAHFAEQAGDSDRAVDLLCRAGVEQYRQGALRSAELALRHGIGLLAAGDAPRRIRLHNALLDVLCAAGDTAEARSIGEDTLVLLRGIDSAPSDVAEVHLRLAQNAVTSGDFATATAHADAARRLVPGGVVAARADVLRAEAAYADADLRAAIDLAEAAVRVADAGDDVELLCSALDVAGRAIRFTDFTRGREVFERLLAVATVAALPLWRSRALLHLGALDMLTDGRVDRLEEASTTAVQAGAMATAAEIEVQTVLILVTQFRLAEATEVAARLAERAERYKLAVEPMALVCRGGCAGWSGNRSEMEQHASRVLEMAGDDPALAALCWGDLRGMNSLFEDDRTRAMQEIGRAMRYPPRPITAPAPFRGMWALLSTVEGADGHLAREVVRHTAAHESWWVLAWLGYADAVALGQAGRAGDAADYARAADDVIDGHVGGAWAKHLARRHVAEAALGDGWGEPVRWLEEAAAFFDGVHPRIATSCRSLLRRAGAVVPRQGRGDATVPAALRTKGVTRREMDVLLLIVRGCTNRDIAARLFLSHRTVEKHVENLLLKLDVASRTQLAVLASSAVA